jgi:hypothetical protein
MTYTREHNGTESLIGSTTIHRLPLEVEFSTGLNYAFQSQPSIPGNPTDLLAGRDVYNRAHDYAGTYIDTDTVLTFLETDLVITYPTPYDEWMDIGIYTNTECVRTLVQRLPDLARQCLWHVQHVHRILVHILDLW